MFGGVRKEEMLREKIIKSIDDITNIKILLFILGYINNIKNKKQ